jgi:hypothetical protein
VDSAVEPDERLSLLDLELETIRRVLERHKGRRKNAAAELGITLRCEEIPSLVDVTRRTDAVLLAIRAAAPDLVELKVQPALTAMARFGLVTLARRTEPPGLSVVRDLMAQRLRDPSGPRVHQPSTWPWPTSFTLASSTVKGRPACALSRPLKPSNRNKTLGNWVGVIMIRPGYVKEG